MAAELVDAQVTPSGTLNILSKKEVSKLLDTSQGGLYKLFRNCSLAVLNCGRVVDDGKALLERYNTFDIQVLQRERGIKLEVKGAPAEAFVEGGIIVGINEHLFAVLRDVIYTSNEIYETGNFNLKISAGITDAVFHILRNADVLQPQVSPQFIVCWGGHSISREEYDYSKSVGYELGLRGLDICTGCGPGAMKGPMKGAAVGHAKQRNPNGRYLGLTEPGIIAAESPNPIVNNLVILPDIEKRLEAFVRVGHGIVVFPGGVGTTEEILYILGILLNPDNQDLPFPLVFTGPASSADYFHQIDQFVANALGSKAQDCYKIIIDDPEAVAIEMRNAMSQVRQYRKDNGDAYYFNWSIKIHGSFQEPFNATHQNMRKLNLLKDQESHKLAANLRRAFSGIVSGNVKDEGIRSIEEHGLFELTGDAELMADMDKLLESFVLQNRMKLDGSEYRPCYRISK